MELEGHRHCQSFERKKMQARFFNPWKDSNFLSSMNHLGILPLACSCMSGTDVNWASQMMDGEKKRFAMNAFERKVSANINCQQQQKKANSNGFKIRRTTLTRTQKKVSDAVNLRNFNNLTFFLSDAFFVGSSTIVRVAGFLFFLCLLAMSSFLRWLISGRVNGCTGG